jgi:hypothetical protein
MHFVHVYLLLYVLALLDRDGTIVFVGNMFRYPFAVDLNG